MPIITLAQTRTLLSIPTADTTKDALIAALIPLVQKKVVNHCGAGSFLALDIQFVADTIAFVSGSTPTITDSDDGFVDALFHAGDINIRFSKSNDGIVGVTTVAAGILTLTSGLTLVDEAAENEVILTQVRWPDEIQLEVAQAISYYLTKEGKLVTSETLPGGYQAQFKSEADVMALFNRYRKPC